MEITKDMFERVPDSEKNLDTVVRPSETYWQDVWRRLKKNKLAMFGLYFVIFITIVAIVGPPIVKYFRNIDYSTQI